MVAVIRRLCILALAALMPLAAVAQPDRQAAEVRIKAAFLYRFTGFVEWPPKAFARSDSPFVVGVLGAEALAAELEQVVSGREVQGRAVVVRRLRRGEPLAGLHMLFVGYAESGRLAEVLGAARGHAVLTVTESEDALAHGSIINFVAVGDKVRFDVALSPAERGNLKISARLLSVARKVVMSSS
ncbi:MAG: YfiR family protein [Burkholderiales bacterium]